MPSPDLLDVLQARRGIVCAVGAGGKKTTLYRILQAHPGRAACTATVFTQVFPDDLPAHVLVAAPGEIVARVVQAAGVHRKLAFACPSHKEGRFAGLAPAQVSACHAGAGFDVTLVKADGARMRLLKAPDEDEPSLPEDTSTVLGLVSARAVGMTLTAGHVHHPERVAAITGAVADAVLTPLHVARLIASSDGLSRGIRQATFIPVINMADTPERRRAALQVAQLALSLGDHYPYVVIAAMLSENPILDVVARAA